MENWRPVVGYEGHYEVSDLGRVRSLDRYVDRHKGFPPDLQKGKMKKLTLNGDGYLVTTLRLPGRRAVVCVHRLVAEAFIGPKPPGFVVRHWDGDRTNCVASNIVYGTVKDNAQDAVRHGTMSKGEGRYNAKLTDAAVRAIRSMVGTRSQISIADEFGVSRGAVCSVLYGVAWKHVE